MDLGSPGSLLRWWLRGYLTILCLAFVKMKGVVFCLLVGILTTRTGVLTLINCGEKYLAYVQAGANFDIIIGNASSKWECHLKANMKSTYSRLVSLSYMMATWLWSITVLVFIYLAVGGITLLCHFSKNDLTPVIICKNTKHLLTLYNVIFSNMIGILSHLSYIFY